LTLALGGDGNKPASKENTDFDGKGWTRSLMQNRQAPSTFLILKDF
jgi:hypothetical protein